MDVNFQVLKNVQMVEGQDGNAIRHVLLYQSCLILSPLMFTQILIRTVVGYLLGYSDDEKLVSADI